MPPEPESEGVSDQVVPAGMCLGPLRLGDHVAVEEDQDVTRGALCAQVPGPGDTESAAFLTDHLDADPVGRGRSQRWVRPVVDHHHREQLARVGLAVERRHRQSELVRALITGDYHGDRALWGPLPHRRGREIDPAIAA